MVMLLPVIQYFSIFDDSCSNLNCMYFIIIFIILCQPTYCCNFDSVTFQYSQPRLSGTSCLSRLASLVPVSINVKTSKIFWFKLCDKKHIFFKIQSCRHFMFRCVTTNAFHWALISLDLLCFRVKFSSALDQSACMVWRTQALVFESTWIHHLSTKYKRSILSIKDKQWVILSLEKRTSFYLSSEYGVNKQQISQVSAKTRIKS